MPEAKTHSAKESHFLDLQNFQLKIFLSHSSRSLHRKATGWSERSCQSTHVWCLFPIWAKIWQISCNQQYKAYQNGISVLEISAEYIRWQTGAQGGGEALERINRACRRCNENLLHLAVARSKSLPSVSYWKGSQQGSDSAEAWTKNWRTTATPCGRSWQDRHEKKPLNFRQLLCSTIDVVVKVSQGLPLTFYINVSFCRHYHF